MRVRRVRAPRNEPVAADLPRRPVEPHEIADARLGRELLLGEIPAAVGKLERVVVRRVTEASDRQAVPAASGR